ncbi:MAG TPA: hypothetical protein VMU13_00995 [Candidatus Paceibacterota bacterium]|nr:hypothetical protein [Candidatus Paceibacterota bacterium]
MVEKAKYQDGLEYCEHCGTNYNSHFETCPKCTMHAEASGFDTHIEAGVENMEEAFRVLRGEREDAGSLAPYGGQDFQPNPGGNPLTSDGNARYFDERRYGDFSSGE